MDSKYIGGAVLAFVTFYIVYKCLNINTLEGLQSKGNPYQKMSEKLESEIKIVKRVLNVDSSRHDIEDILTSLDKLMDLGQLHILLDYATGKIEPSTTQQTADKLKSYHIIRAAVDKGLSTLDKMSNR